MDAEHQPTDLAVGARVRRQPRRLVPVAAGSQPAAGLATGSGPPGGRAPLGPGSGRTAPSPPAARWSSGPRPRPTGRRSVNRAVAETLHALAVDRIPRPTVLGPRRAGRRAGPCLEVWSAPAQLIALPVRPRMKPPACDYHPPAQMIRPRQVPPTDRGRRPSWACGLSQPSPRPGSSRTASMPATNPGLALARCGRCTLTPAAARH
jgi:hypothetical protein